MYNVFINGKSVNTFDNVQEAYDFAIAIESGDVMQPEFKSGKDKVSFEGIGCVQTVKEYELDLANE